MLVARCVQVAADEMEYLLNKAAVASFSHFPGSICFFDATGTNST